MHRVNLWLLTLCLCFAPTHTICNQKKNFFFGYRLDRLFVLLCALFVYVTGCLFFKWHLLTRGIEFLAKNSLRPALRAINDTILTD